MRHEITQAYQLILLVFIDLFFPPSFISQELYSVREREKEWMNEWANRNVGRTKKIIPEWNSHKFGVIFFLVHHKWSSIVLGLSLWEAAAQQQNEKKETGNKVVIRAHVPTKPHRFILENCELVSLWKCTRQLWSTLHQQIYWLSCH